MQRFVLPANATGWGALKHETPAPPPRLPARYRPPSAPVKEPKEKPSPRGGRAFHQRANICLACKKPFGTAQARYKLVFMPHGARGDGQRSGLGIDFCEECGPKAEEALKSFFGGDSRQPY